MSYSSQHGEAQDTAFASHFIGLAVVQLMPLFIPADRPASIRHFSPESVRHASSCRQELLPKQKCEIDGGFRAQERVGGK